MTKKERTHRRYIRDKLNYIKNSTTQNALKAKISEVAFDLYNLNPSGKTVWFLYTYKIKYCICNSIKTEIKYLIRGNRFYPVEKLKEFLYDKFVEIRKKRKKRKELNRNLEVLELHERLLKYKKIKFKKLISHCLRKVRSKYVYGYNVCLTFGETIIAKGERETELREYTKNMHYYTTSSVTYSFQVPSNWFYIVLKKYNIPTVDNNIILEIESEEFVNNTIILEATWARMGVGYTLVKECGFVTIDKSGNSKCHKISNIHRLINKIRKEF